MLLDYQLPGGDGLDVLRTVKEDDTGPPAIILTGHNDEQTAVEFRALPISDVAKGDDRTNGDTSSVIGVAM